MNNKRIISLFIVLLFVNLPLSTAFSFVTGRQASDINPVCGDGLCQGEEKYYCAEDCEVKNLTPKDTCLLKCPDCVDLPLPPQPHECSAELNSGTWPASKIPQWPLIIPRINSSKQIIINIADVLSKENVAKPNLISGSAVKDPQQQFFEEVYGEIFVFIDGLIKTQESNDAVDEINKVSQCLNELSGEIKVATEYLSRCADEKLLDSLQDSINSINNAMNSVDNAHRHLQYGISPFTPEFISKLFDPEGIDTDFVLKQLNQRGAQNIIP